MSENRFSASLTPLQVMIRYGIITCSAYTFDELTAIATDALARIAELSPRTVDAAGRERAVDILESCHWIASPKVLDEIIDALGYTVAPQPKPERARDYFDTLVVPASTDAPHQCTDVRDDCCERTPAPAPPAPVVELDARAKVTDLNVDDLETLRDRLNEWPPIASGLGISERHAIPTDIGWIVHDGRAWVLRIGGDQ